ncbi:hypothetical protein VP01_952g6 [Puccinia sorghi]|uniref:Uncharacterized protein n=1 Tax=Puccinia sorghi TaxID=27349 RepID=A0A0L6U6B8_9BASI|nr:hypothetical protein VP01_952g6 [Puccinia sorghi]
MQFSGTDYILLTGCLKRYLKSTSNHFATLWQYSQPKPLNPYSHNPPATMYTTVLTNLKTIDLSSLASSICPHCKKLGHQPSNCWVKHP